MNDPKLSVVSLTAEIKVHTLYAHSCMHMAGRVQCGLGGSAAGGMLSTWNFCYM